MKELIWNNSFSVGIKKFDEQHQQLFGYLNELKKSLKSKEKGKSIASKTINDLILYTLFHFGEEEKILIKYAYPDYESHKNIHEKLRTKVQVYHDDLNSGKKIINIEELVDFLTEWIQNHILETDKNYSQFLKSKGLS